MPASFAKRLRPFGEHLFTTRELEHGPYAMDVLVGEVVADGSVADYAVLGFDGYGVNSWAVHYVVVQRALALFLQFAWGGAYVDVEAAREVVTEGFGFGEALQGAMERAVSQGRVADDTRLVVSVSDFGASRWAWAGRAGVEPEWALGDVYGGVVAAMDSLFDGSART